MTKSNALSVVHAAELDVVPEEKLELLRHTYGKDLDLAEFDLFVHAARRLELDPFAGQICAVKRGGRISIQTTIDGFRSVAEKTGEYEGQTTPQWCAEDGEWRDVWLSKAKPAAARVGVYRKGFREPMYAVAPFDAYNQGNGWWKSSGGAAHMLAKCAEALALRKAFPRVLGGVYSKDEMANTEMGQAIVEEPPPAANATQPEPAAVDGEWQEAPEAEPEIPEWATKAAEHIAKLRADIGDDDTIRKACSFGPKSDLDDLLSPAGLARRSRETVKTLYARIRKASGAVTKADVLKWCQEHRVSPSERNGALSKPLDELAPEAALAELKDYVAQRDRG